jgi:hypothetical protein
MQAPAFQLPIAYQESRCVVPHSLDVDLELNEAQDAGGKSLIERVVGTHLTAFGEMTMPMWTRYYTPDVAFLQDTQQLIASDLPAVTRRYEEMANVWKDVRSETSFHDRYQFIEWDWLEPLNRNPEFLQALSMYNMGSPVLSLALPILLLIMPLFLLRAQGRRVSVADYIAALKQVLKNHQIGQLFTVSSASWDKRTYIVISFVFYVFQVYQNVLACTRFHRNMYKIHSDVVTVSEFASDAVHLMDTYAETASAWPTYAPFVEATMHHRCVLDKLLRSTRQVSRWQLSMSRVRGVGHAMHCYYRICRSDDVVAALDYAIRFVGYYDNIMSMRKSLAAKRLAPCTFSGEHTSFRGAYFPGQSRMHPVKNTYTLKHQLMITGPNASGKTTILKTTLLNVLLCQQIGMGFFKSAKLVPYDHIHCYLNIPDTSGRDSLFQAEARRCKDILDAVQASPPDSRHFCVFDELYSGTNPTEAVASATAFLRYLNRFPGVSYVVTTHFTDLCRRLESETRVRNYRMATRERDGNLRYVYRLADGVSSVRGGSRVLAALEYPPEILENAKHVMAEVDV